MADRGFGSGLEAAMSAERSTLAIMLYLDWPGGAIRLGSWVGTKPYGGNDWLGAGDLIDIDKVLDTVDKADVGVNVTINYLNDDLRNELTTTPSEDIVGTTASIFLALMDVDAGTITEAYEIFPGKLDDVEIEDAGATGSITLRLANELAGLGKRQFLRLTDAHQKYLFPGDRGLEYSTKMDEPILWGRKPLQPVGKPPPYVPPGYGSETPAPAFDPGSLPGGFSPYPGFEP